MKVIFLDIDGVLNATYYVNSLINQHLTYQDKYGPLFSPYSVEALQKVINATGAKIVISSSWKRNLGQIILQRMWLDRGLPGEVIDVIPDLSAQELLDIDPNTDISKLKGYEIDKWINEYEVNTGSKLTSYVIVDDEEVCLPHQLEHFVRTYYRDGLYEEAGKMIELLNGTP